MSSLIERFEQLVLSPPLLETLKELGYEAPSPIQAATIPPMLDGCDVLGQAQTGTGKTAAFALPILEKLSLSSREPQALVLTPTRELAIQVAEAFQGYARHIPGFHVLPIYGGQSMSLQLRHLRRGVHVVVGTPGRVMDHLRRETLSLAALRTVVLDEADEMLRMGFIDDVDWILEQTPAEKQVALFSATMPEPIRRVAHRHLRDPHEVKIETRTATVATVRQRYCQVGAQHKLDALTRVLEVEDADAILIFVRTKIAATELAERLEARGYPSAALHGDMTQALREKTIEQLRGGSLDIVVATDVAARGLDVQRISHVINYDIPYDTEAYIHRIGRTGRAGRAGDAILFIAPRELRLLRAIEKATRQPIERMPLPTPEAITGHRLAQFKQQVGEVFNSQDLGFFQELITEIEREQEMSAYDIASALTYLAQRDRPFQFEDAIPKDAEKERARPPGRATREGRSSRGERSARDAADFDKIRYRIDVGREHGATPQNIMGAIANEAGIEGRYIGRIEIHNDYSTVDLPDGMPPEIFQHLKRVRVRQQMLNIRRLDGAEPERKRPGKPKAERGSSHREPAVERKSHRRRSTQPTVD
ncbi:MAG: DEAD/DEAH box helicase [Candidatus Competibacteraceae bacterium]|nr:DEAD/DEAH box helicase [Candidatus Competibacteraceae bacterium]MCP5126754.1 DEAD/DEAH box helicase [Gammaproteobacteria bacterium]HRX71068.1 DEAD/DEAH box helicase [Candidatus Competibacteraceae bacterium]